MIKYNGNCLAKQKNVLFTTLFCILLALLTISLAFTSVSVKSVALGKRELPIYCVDTTKKQVAITFDCAWGTDSTQKILDCMQEYGVCCTFFATEFWVDKYPDMVKKIVDMGHEMGTHSKTHSHMAKLSGADISEELISSSGKIERITNQKVTLFRAPFGEYNNQLITTSRALGLQVIQWDVDSLDWKDLSAEQIALRVTKKAVNGSIILCHNNGLHTASALPLIFSSLQSRGMQFVKVSDLIIKGDYYIDNNGKQFAVE